jgi:hypothetical protein
MKKMSCDTKTRALASSENFREATSAELGFVQGGLLQMLIPFAGKALADYLIKLATEPGPGDHAIEPLN